LAQALKSPFRTRSRDGCLACGTVMARRLHRTAVITTTPFVSQLIFGGGLFERGWRGMQFNRGWAVQIGLNRDNVGTEVE
jgi:hypothetical protein